MQRMSYAPEIPEPEPGVDLEHWASTVLAGVRRATLGKRRAATLKLLVVTRGRVVTLDEDGFAWRSEHGYGAIGSGATLALGRLAGSGHARQRAEEAIMAAARHSPWVSEPVHTLWVPA